MVVIVVIVVLVVLVVFVILMVSYLEPGGVPSRHASEPAKASVRV
jgi:hypothetical protein